METFSRILVGALAVGLVALAGFPLFKTISADGRVQYCYVETERHVVPNRADIVVYSVHGFRNWRADRVIATALNSLEDAQAAAKEYGCELR